MAGPAVRPPDLDGAKQSVPSPESSETAPSPIKDAAERLYEDLIGSLPFKDRSTLPNSRIDPSTIAELALFASFNSSSVQIIREGIQVELSRIGNEHDPVVQAMRKELYSLLEEVPLWQAASNNLARGLHRAGNPRTSYNNLEYTKLALISISNYIHFKDESDPVELDHDPKYKDPTYLLESGLDDRDKIDNLMKVSLGLSESCANILYNLRLVHIDKTASDLSDKLRNDSGFEAKFKQLFLKELRAGLVDFRKRFSQTGGSARPASATAEGQAAEGHAAEGHAAAPAGVPAAEAPAAEAPAGVPAGVPAAEGGAPAQPVDAAELEDLRARLATAEARAASAEAKAAEAERAATKAADHTNRINDETQSIKNASDSAKGAAAGAGIARNDSLATLKRILGENCGTLDQQTADAEAAKAAAADAESKAKSAGVLAELATRLAEEPLTDAVKNDPELASDVGKAANEFSYEARQSAQSAEISAFQAQKYADLATKTVELRNGLEELNATTSSFDANIVAVEAAHTESIKKFKEFRKPISDSPESSARSDRSKTAALNNARTEAYKALSDARAALNELSPIAELAANLKEEIKSENSGLQEVDATSLQTGLEKVTKDLNTKLANAKAKYLRAMALKTWVDNPELIDFVVPKLRGTPIAHDDTNSVIDLIKELHNYKVKEGLLSQLPRKLDDAGTPEKKIKLLALLFFRANDIANQSIIQLRLKKDAEAAVLNSPVVTDRVNGQTKDRTIHTLDEIRNSGDFNRLSKQDQRLVYAQIEELHAVSREIMHVMDEVEQSVKSARDKPKDASAADAASAAELNKLNKLLVDNAEFHKYMKASFDADSGDETAKTLNIENILLGVNTRLNFDAPGIKSEQSQGVVNHLRGLADQLSYRAYFKKYAGSGSGALETLIQSMNYKRKADGNHKAHRKDMTAQYLLEVAKQIEPDSISKDNRQKSSPREVAFVTQPTDGDINNNRFFEKYEQGENTRAKVLMAVLAFDGFNLNRARSDKPIGGGYAAPVYSRAGASLGYKGTDDMQFKKGPIEQDKTLQVESTANGNRKPFMKVLRKALGGGNLLGRSSVNTDSNKAQVLAISEGVYKKYFTTTDSEGQFVWSNELLNNTTSVHEMHKLASDAIVAMHEHARAANSGDVEELLLRMDAWQKGISATLTDARKQVGGRPTAESLRMDESELNTNKAYLKNFIEKLVIAPRNRLNQPVAEGDVDATQARNTIDLARSKLEWGIQAKRNKSRKIILFGSDRMGAVRQADLELVARNQLTLQTLLGTLPTPFVENATLRKGFNPDTFANVWLDIKNATESADLGGMKNESKNELKRVVEDLEDLIFPKPVQTNATLFRPDERRLTRGDASKGVVVGSIAGKAKAAWAEFDVASGTGRDDDLRNKKSMLSAALTEVLGALVVPLAIREKVRKPVKLLRVPLQLPWTKMGITRFKKVDKGEIRPALLKTDKAKIALATVRAVWDDVAKAVLNDGIEKLVVNAPNGISRDSLNDLIEKSKSAGSANAADREKLVGILNEAFTALQDQGETAEALPDLEKASKQLQIVFDLEANLMALVDLHTRMDVEETEWKLTVGGVDARTSSKKTADTAFRLGQQVVVEPRSKSTP
ncbi:MAG: hypothetical protein QE278_14640 [Limnobacter sp.]|nr:hypothetical protein [Limnobacter sp.]